MTGRRMAQLLLASCARVVAVDPRVFGADGGVEVKPLPAALALADIVTLHASGEDPILGRAEFELLKPGALLLNAGRGGLVDEEALCAAPLRGRVADAWLDTSCQEPYTGPLAGYSQVLLTPHVGSLTMECRRRMEAEAVDNLLEALRSGC